MPIRKENKKRYPPNWKQISEDIRFGRAGGECECEGQCGKHVGRCGAYHGGINPATGSVVVLTVMHLDHTPENCDYTNLLAGCQRCHLAYDAGHHAQTAARTREKELLDLGQEFLPLDELELREMASTQKGEA
jgi:hypothetical protein